MVYIYFQQHENILLF